MSRVFSFLVREHNSLGICLINSSLDHSVEGLEAVLEADVQPPQGVDHVVFAVLRPTLLLALETL